MAKYDAMGDKVQRRIPIALWVMLLGLVIGITGTVWCAMGGLDKFIKTENLSETYDGSDIKVCDIDLAGGKHNIIRSSDGKIHVTADNVIEGLYTMECENGKFSFKQKKFSFNIVHLIGGSSNFFGFYKKEAKITIELPDKEYEKLDIDNGMGELNVSGLSAQNLNVDNGIGELNISNVKAEKSDIDNGIGKIEISSCDLGSTKLDNGIGKIKVTDSKLKETEIDNGIGDTTVNAEINGNIEIDNGIGDTIIEIIGDKGDYRYKKDKDKSAKYTIDIDNGLGDVRVAYSG